MEAARRTKSFMRKGTFPAIAGNPATGSHPFGMKGMMVTVVTNVKVEPIAPRDSQSLIPEAQEQERAEQPFRNTQEPACPSDAKRGIEPENERSVADIGDQHLSFVLKPLLVAKGQEYEHHRRSDEMIVDVTLENAGFG